MRSDQNNNFYIGVDIGATHVRISCQKDTDEFCIPDIDKIDFFKSSSAETEIEYICNAIEGVVSQEDFRHFTLSGIGVSLAAIFDRTTGDIINWPNNPLWNGFPFQKYVTNRFGVPVVLEDDANAAALGELFFGGGIGHSNLAYITISTGIGCGFIIDRKVFTGDNGWAGEIGHIQLDKDGPPCVCGNTGCLQAFASGRALMSRIAALNMLQAGEKPKTFAEAVKLAQAHISPYKEMFEETGVYLARAIKLIVTMMDLRLFILGGGVTQAGDVLMKPLRKYFDGDDLRLNRKVSIVVSDLSDINGVLGAIALIKEKTGE